MRRYSQVQVFVNNLPYVLMTVLGSAVLAVALWATPWTWAAAGGYLAYGVAGAFWIMIFVCPHCGYYGPAQTCPCGYGQISARLRRKGDVECFSKKFKRHIPVIVPLWFIPPVAGGVIAAYRFSWLLVGLIAAFAVDAFVILPLFSRMHGCAECPQKDDCPWMGTKSSAPAETDERPASDG